MAFEPDIFRFPNRLGTVWEAVKCKQIKLLKTLRPLRHSFSHYLGLPRVLPTFGPPEVASALERLCKARAQILEWAHFFGADSLEVMGMGFPLDPGMSLNAPFDRSGDSVQETSGLKLDTYRRPEKIIAAMERLVLIMMELRILTAGWD